jgi:hypothetical protein
LCLFKKDDCVVGKWGKRWDEQDATKFGEQTEVEFNVNIQSQHRYYSLDNSLAEKLSTFTKKRC